MLEEIKFAYKNIKSQKGRSFLTLLGMVIGIGIIVAMLALGEGMKYSVKQQLDKVGGDKITIFPAGSFEAMFGAPQENIAFTEKELNEIKKIPGVKNAVPYFIKADRVKFGSEEEIVNIQATTREEIDIFSNFYSINEGRFFRDYEDNAVNIGYKLANDVFDRKIRVGDEIEISGKKFKVVGILEEMGNRQDDTSVFMPLRAAWSLYDARGEITAIFVVADNENIVKEVKERIEDKLEDMRKGKDFEVATTEEFGKQIARVLNIIEFVLAGIAAVSLFVGGIIIMNTMLVNVMERTREIGTLVAIGARRMDIVKLFLVESSLLGLFGGVFGIIFGIGIAKIIESAGSRISSAFATLVTKELIIGVILFSMLVGMLSGAYPAYRAAKLEPVEALKYE